MHVKKECLSLSDCILLPSKYNKKKKKTRRRRRFFLSWLYGLGHLHAKHGPQIKGEVAQVQLMVIRMSSGMYLQREIVSLSPP